MPLSRKSLHTLLDNSFDSPVDARFGKLREQSLAGSTSSTSQAWSVDERMAIGSTTSTSLDESQVAEVGGYLKMTR